MLRFPEKDSTIHVSAAAYLFKDCSKSTPWRRVAIGKKAEEQGDGAWATVSRQPSLRASPSAALS
jgi:hypothetical protein